MVEVVKPHLRLWVDGRVILEGWERRGRAKDIRIAPLSPPMLFTDEPLDD